MNLPCGVAQLLVGVAEERALSLGVPVAVAFSDAQGSLIFFSRMEGALPAAPDIAVSKAYTAAALRMPTHELGAMSRPGEILYGIQNLQPGRIVLFGGGFPVFLFGRPAGGIGVSGGTVEEDMDIARCALQALQAMEVWADPLEPAVAMLPGKRWTALAILTAVSTALGTQGLRLGEPDERTLAGGWILAAERIGR